MSIQDKLDFGDSLAQKLTGNLNFPAPAPTPAQVTAATNALRAASNDYNVTVKRNATATKHQIMKPKFKLFHARLFCAVTLGIGSPFGLSAAAKDSADTAPAKTSIPWSQIGAKAGADYKGDGL